jgi:hypothetical protein
MYGLQNRGRTADGQIMARTFGKLLLIPILLLGCAQDDFGSQPTSSAANSLASAATEAASEPTTQATTMSDGSYAETNAASPEVTSSSLAVPVLMNANADLERVDLEAYLDQRGVMASVKECALKYARGPGLESINRWMLATRTMPGSSSIEALIVASTSKGVLICDRTAEIMKMLPDLPEADVPITEARCVLNRSFDWLATRPDESFILDPWAFDDQPAHDELQAKVASCGLSRDYVDYLLNPAGNPIANEAGEIVIPIRQ